MNEQQEKYTEEQLSLLKKAGLLKTGIKTLQARMSSAKHPYFDEERGMWTENSPKSQPVEDRSDIPEKVPPMMDRHGNIVGDWKRGMTEDQILMMQSWFGLPIYTVAHTLTNANSGMTQTIKDSQIVLRHGQVFNLSMPRECAEWNIIEHNGVLAASQAECMVSSIAAFWVYDEVESFKTTKKDVDRQLEIAALPGKTRMEEKVAVAWLLHFENIRPIEGKDTDKQKLELIFDLCCLTNANDIERIYAYSNKRERLALHLLIEQGRVVKYGSDGPYHLERKGSGEDRGELLGETTSQAVDNLYKPNFASLPPLVREEIKGMMYEKTKDEVVQEIKEDLELMKFSVFQKLNKAGMQKALKDMKIDFDPNSTNDSLCELYQEYLEKEVV